MPWLVRGDWVLASRELAESPNTRVLELFGQTSRYGAALVRQAHSIHNLGIRPLIDVAHLEVDLRFLCTTGIDHNDIGRPVRRSSMVPEVECFARWSLKGINELEVLSDDNRPHVRVTR